MKLIKFIFYKYNLRFGNTAFLWAVSQAAPLRRVFVNGNLLLF